MKHAHRIVLSLGFMFAAGLAVAEVQEAAPQLLAADGRPIQFEVVSVKANRSGATATDIASPPMGDGMAITNMPLMTIVRWAFGINLEDRISGVPAWAKQERYDITAKVSDADLAAFRRVSDPIQRTPMLQKVLVDRFELKYHYETKVIPVYTLIVGRNGIRMTEIDPPIGPNGMRDGGSRRMSPGHIESMGQPIKPLVNALSTELRRVVVDDTGLKGYYKFTLTWTPEAKTAQPNNASDSSAPSLFTALQEQLGLKLESTKAPVEVLVIDDLKRPSSN